MKFTSLKKGEIAATFLISAVAASGVIINYSAKELCGPGFASFAKEWIIHPTEVGACTPCSKHVAAEVVHFVKPQSGKTLRVLEVGAGTGTFTREMVNQLGSASYQLDAIEINETFCSTLKKEFAAFSKVAIHQADITKWQPKQKYDVIISALPFNIFDIKTVESILDSYKSWLAPGGRISYIELAGLTTLRNVFTSGEMKSSFTKKYQLISNFKNQHLEKTVTVYKNIPPIHVHHLKI